MENQEEDEKAQSATESQNHEQRAVSSSGAWKGRRPSRIVEEAFQLFCGPQASMDLCTFRCFCHHSSLLAVDTDLVANASYADDVFSATVPPGHDSMCLHEFKAALQLLVERQRAATSAPLGMTSCLRDADLMASTGHTGAGRNSLMERWQAFREDATQSTPKSPSHHRSSPRSSQGLRLGCGQESGSDSPPRVAKKLPPKVGCGSTRTTEAGRRTSSVSIRSSHQAAIAIRWTPPLEYSWDSPRTVSQEWQQFPRTCAVGGA